MSSVPTAAPRRRSALLALFVALGLMLLGVLAACGSDDGPTPIDASQEPAATPPAEPTTPVAEPTTPPQDSTDATVPFEARGNEPGWILTVAEDRIDIVWDFGAKEAAVPRPQPTATGSGYRYQASTEAHSLTVDVFDEICRDDATGMPHPTRVVVVIDGQELRGCGGEPASLLTGTWNVLTIDGVTNLPDSVEVTFAADGTISGDTGCNSFSGGYSLTGEGLTTGALAATLRACADSDGAAEQPMLALVENLARFDIDDNGHLVLITFDESRLTAELS